MANEKDKKLQSKEPKMVSLVRHNSINSGRPNCEYSLCLLYINYLGTRKIIIYIYRCGTVKLSLFHYYYYLLWIICYPLCETDGLCTFMSITACFHHALIHNDKNQFIDFMSCMNTIIRCLCFPSPVSDIAEFQKSYRRGERFTKCRDHSTNV